MDDCANCGIDYWDCGKDWMGKCCPECYHEDYEDWDWEPEEPDHWFEDDVKI